MTKDEVLARITRFYIESGDFNGVPVSQFAAGENIREIVSELVRDRLVAVNLGDFHPNPHIKAFDPEPVERQLEKIQSPAFDGACLYPSPGHLEKIVDRHAHRDRPFTLRLYLGEPQLKYYAFDLSVLEFYRNDPRYHYDVDDISGRISITSWHAESGAVREADQIVLETFGFAYDEKMNRAVAAYLRYLHDLSPEHQRLWEARRLEGRFKLHPDYHLNTMGHFREHESVFTAFIEEVSHINEMARRMGRPPLFRQEYQESKRPRYFGFLIRPTLRELNSFIHLLDKMLSDNFDLKFFQGEVPLEQERRRKDGRVVVSRKGSIQVLDDWLARGTIRFPDTRPKEEMLRTLRKIRKLRQTPAHAEEEDAFDQRYFKEQRELVIEAYKAVRTLRLILANHPAVHGYEIPDWLRQGKIRTF